MQQKFDSTTRKKSIKHLVIHSFALPTEKMLDTLSQYKLSVHYLIDAKGYIHSLVPEKQVAWHAGPSFWAGEKGLNWTSVGIELEHLDYGQTKYPDQQIETLTKLAHEIIQRHHIRPENIVGHSDIAPEAKIDPGRGFPWQKLAEQGIGLWYDVNDDHKMKDLSTKEALDFIGYPTQGRQLEASCWAFCQRFMPQIVPYDNQIAEREKKVFQARQVATKLPPSEQEKILTTAPTIYPQYCETYLVNPEFTKTVRAVAYQYKKAREK